MSEENESVYTGEAREMAYAFKERPEEGYSDLTPLAPDRRGIFRLHTARRYGRRFLLKSIAPKFADDPLYRMALRKEFEIGMTLDHPNIRRTLAFEHVDGAMFAEAEGEDAEVEARPDGVGECLVLEYIDGEPLSRALENGRITSGNGRRIASRLADALQYIHAKQIYHRDLKPDNILITYAGTDVKLIDFSLSDSEAFAVLKNPAGTAGYMAPEQRSPGARPSVEADIYSLGVILRELATRTGDRELRRIAARCSRPDPDERPHSIAETGLLDLSPTPKTPLLDRPVLTYILTAAVALLAFLTWK